MSKKNNKKKKGNSKSYKTNYKKEILVLLVFFIVAGIIISTIYNMTNVNNKKKQTGVEVMELKEFIEVSVDTVVEKINNKETFVLYIGYPGCQACEKYNPILKRIQSQNESDTFYLNYKLVDKKSKSWSKLIKNINIEQKITIDEDDNKKVIKDTIGNIMKDYGYTPVTIYFVAGKCVNAKIGTMDSTELKSFLGV